MLRFPAHVKHIGLPRITSYTSSIKRIQSRYRPFHNSAPLFTMPSDTEAIKTLFQAYESALRHSSTPEVVPLYAPTGVFMAQHFPTAIGTSAIAAAYDKVFDAIVLAPTFSVHEVEVFDGGEWAFARTSSAGSTRIKVSGKLVREANQELFVLQKLGGEWKIARYCFCSVLPPGEA